MVDKFLFTGNLFVFTGSLLDLSDTISVYSFFKQIGGHMISFFNNNFGKIHYDFRFNFLLNTPVANLADSNLNVFLGLNLRIESPLLNARLRKQFLNTVCVTKFYGNYSVGLALNYASYPIMNLGNTVGAVLNIANYSSPLLLNCCFDFKANLTSLLNLTIVHTHKTNVFMGSRFFLGAPGLVRLNMIGLFQKFRVVSKK